ncbi:DUF5034 domain-containing protein [Xanthocytophaga agilis]|uniref:DUF5034 domain-containing protein n=1 Tax=Xanthocytophaga agilis TaxID=3048010 RepID=A0AAE3R7S8_9BACT|nr:DUF5034 domain-containing protein [Xanthocytophaga agilis]MDJ1502327.1 DUF5034 domain-containing protein [Xanthocytophaga agilis]
MKTIRILSLTFLISVAPLFLTGCCWFSTCGCGDNFSQKYFKVNGWKATNVLIDSTVTNGYPYVRLDSLSKTASYAYNKVGINLEVKAEYYSAISINSYGTLMACDPLPNGHEGSKEKISTIQIISNQDFDTEHPAGTDLADLFLIKKMGFYNSWSEDVAVNLRTYSNGQPSPELAYTLWLAKPPVSSKKHIFTITYEQTNGDKYTVTTRELTFS